MGGLPRRSGFLKSRFPDPDSRPLLLDSGGAFVKSLEESRRHFSLTLLKSTYMVDALNRLGYLLYNIGTYDVILGPKELKALMDASRFNWISSNLKTGKGGWFANRWLMRDLGGLRVGFFGLLSPEAPLEAVGRQGEFSIQDPVEAARDMVALLKERDCRLIILLSSLGIDEEKRLASTVEGIDVIFGGYSRSLTLKPEFEGRTLIVQAGSKGASIGRLRLSLEGEGTWSPAGDGLKGAGKGRYYLWEVQALDRTWADDPEIVSLLARYKDELEERSMPLQDIKKATLGTESSVYAGANACSPCHLEIFREWITSSHAQAFAVLEKGHQDYNPECLVCHTTGYEHVSGFETARLTPHLQGVQCESCHGPGIGHRGRGDITYPTEADCRRCHDGENSPLFLFRPYLERLGGHALGAHAKTRSKP